MNMTAVDEAGKETSDVATRCSAAAQAWLADNSNIVPLMANQRRRHHLSHVSSHSQALMPKNSNKTSSLQTSER